MLRRFLLLPLLAVFGAEPASAQGDLAAELRQAVLPCWAPIDGSTAQPTVRFTIDRTGALIGEPSIAEPADDAEGRAADASALRAVLRCAPFPGLAPFLDRDETDISLSFSHDDPAAPPAPPLVEIRALDGMVFRIPEPRGICHVDPKRSRTEAEYVRLMADYMLDAEVLGYFLDCASVAELRAGNEDFALPQNYMILHVPADGEGEILRRPDRSLEGALDEYRALFAPDAPGQPVDRTARDAESRLEAQTGMTIDAGGHTLMGSDAHAVYIQMPFEVGGGSAAMTSIGAFSQILDVPVILSLYAPAGIGLEPVLLAEARRLMATLHARSGTE